MRKVEPYWPEEIVGTGELVVYLADYVALEAECERLANELRRQGEQLVESMHEKHRIRAELEAERDALRQQLADSDAALRESRANDTAAMGHFADMRQQRDKLAEALRRGVDHVTNARHDVEVRANAGNEAAKLVLAGIDSWLINDARAALAELTQ